MPRVDLLVVAVVAVAVGVAVGWLARTSSSSPGAAEARVKDLETEVARLRKEATASAPATGPTLEAAAPRPGPSDAGLSAAAPVPSPSPPTPPPPTTAPAAGDPAATAKASSAPRYVFPGLEEAVKAVDWAVVGKNMAEMAPAISRFAEEFAKTGQYPPDLVGRIQELNGPLVTAALKASKPLGIGNPNAAFTHPAFMSNAIAAALEAAGKPLSADQAQALGKVAEQAAEQDRRRLAGYDEQAYALTKAIDESVGRDEFFSAAFNLLTPEQRDLLQPAPTRGRLQADLFSSGLIWLTRCQILPFKDREGVVADMERKMFQNMPLPEDRRLLVHDAIVEWGNALPRELLESAPDALSQKGMVPVTAVVDAARRQLALFQRLVDSGRFDDLTQKRIRAIDFVLAPVKSGPAAN